MISSFSNLITLKEISKMSLILIKNVLNYDLHEDED